MEAKVCGHCNKTFEKNTYGKAWKVKQYCSRVCSGAAARVGTEKPCKNCGVAMYVMPYQLGGSKEKKYCSQTCRNKARPVTDKTRKKISASNTGKKRSNYNYRGEKHWNWQGGKTSEDRKERIRFRRTMQKRVFERDEYTCTVCQAKGNIQVDHIKKWSDYPELRFDIDNCRTLCMACHYYVTFKRKLPNGVVWGHNLSRRVAS